MLTHLIDPDPYEWNGCEEHEEKFERIKDMVREMRDAFVSMDCSIEEFENMCKNLCIECDLYTPYELKKNKLNIA